MYRIVARLLLILCVLNVTVGALAIECEAAGHAHKTASFIDATAHAGEGGDEQSAPCDDEDCASHQCHFGHCQFNLSHPAIALPAPRESRELWIAAASAPAEVYLPNPIEPPLA